MLSLHTFSARPVVDLTALFSGLNQSPPRLPFYLFYDELGSELFRQITQTPEYYLTRTEKEILQRYGGVIAEACGYHRVWFEPGAGCCDKVLSLLNHAKARAYIAMDIASSALRDATILLEKQLPDLPIHLVTGDFAHDLPRLETLMPDAPRTVFYPGSSIGNFTPEEAQAWLSQLAAVAGSDGQLLLGFDLPKPEALLHAAYNDSDHITERFHLNVIKHLQRLGVDVNDRDFAHNAFYNEQEQRIEMHLRCLRQTTLRWQQHGVELLADQSIVTEYSYKYSEPKMQQIARNAGWQFRQSWHDHQRWFALALFDRVQ